METKFSKIMYLGVQILSGALTALSIVGIILSLVNDNDEAFSQYLFNFTQTALMFAVTFVPLVLKKNIKLAIPAAIQVIFLIFCICHFILGEFGEFYLHVPHWDSILHFIGGSLTAILGFCFVDILNNSSRTKSYLTPVFLAIFAVCFTITVGVIWEIYEFASDIILGTNMQRYMDSVTGEVFIGMDALKDTMKDLILESISAVAVAVVYIFNSKFRSKIDDYKIEKIKKNVTDEFDDSNLVLVEADEYESNDVVLAEIEEELDLVLKEL